MAQIITLTTDFGTRDFYAASLKGAIWKAAPTANIVDITNHVNPFNIQEAAFILRNAWRQFPAGTIHVVSVSDHEDADCRYLVLKHRDQYFIGSDNGLFSMVFDEEPELAYEPISFPQNSHNKLVADVSAYILADKPLADIGKPIFEIRKLTALAPVIQESIVRGTVIYVDRFENVITNITRKLFDDVKGNRRFVIYFKRNERVTEVSSDFYDVPEGEKLCIFNAAGYLEIAINKGKASSLLGLKVGDSVQIDFE